MIIGQFTQEDWDTLVMLRQNMFNGSREERVYNHILSIYKEGSNNEGDSPSQPSAAA